MTTDLPPPYFVFVFGAPAAGKGTFCKELRGYDLYNNIAHISIGDCLREAKENGALSQDVLSALEEQKLMNYEQLAPLLKTKIAEEHQRGAKVILLDGFPRNQEQMTKFMEVYTVHLAVLIDTPADIACVQYLSRKDPLRAGDNEELFSTRYAEFEKNNPALIRHFASHGQLVTVNTGFTRQFSTMYYFPELPKLLSEHPAARQVFKDTKILDQLSHPNMTRPQLPNISSGDDVEHSPKRRKMADGSGATEHKRAE